MADETQHVQQISRENRMIYHLPFMIKAVEVVLAVFAIGLIVDPMNSFQRILIKSHFKLDDAAIIYISIAGYIIINSLFIICHLLGDRIPKRTLILFASMGALLHVVAGAVIVYDWRKPMGPYYNNELYPSKQYLDMFISGAVFTFVDALVFVIEIVFIIRTSTKSVE
ncbi:uncharacterized protein LOC105663129 [Megachile rotundata]|uniref:uncharacterized protein LOC105663129 n=1 Tax=Megachile rotundata TaxID=143995 RepID=UPI0006153E77|nr:PREDICTED: uncharacterized protein LOC105663129 [Megachile rotundata]XP_012145753.1 PREDICTED: uncharacterized protein LOC105663129 [Megachile rotundata]XP_012145755.1 PREDICTED: uncharacterized protein LOC105663129 [Megachile rotundata]XP_012145756.1 PREDICTED: uncharacterized protein LOC105663129 [Megachile rotundata]